MTILTSRFDATLPAYEGKENLHIHRVGKTRISFMVRALVQGISILKKHPDIGVIHTSTYGGAIPASILGKLFHKRVILTVHEIF